MSSEEPVECFLKLVIDKTAKLRECVYTQIKRAYEIRVGIPRKFFCI